MINSLYHFDCYSLFSFGVVALEYLTKSTPAKLLIKKDLILPNYFFFILIFHYLIYLQSFKIKPSLSVDIDIK